jgi:hypothetical protein
MGKKENIIPVSAEVNTEEQWLGLRDLQVKFKQFEKATIFEKNLLPKKVGDFFRFLYLCTYIEVDL